MSYSPSEKVINRARNCQEMESDDVQGVTGTWVQVSEFGSPEENFETSIQVLGVHLGGTEKISGE